MKDLVYKRSFTVVNVGNNCYISYLLHKMGAKVAVLFAKKKYHLHLDEYITIKLR